MTFIKHSRNNNNTAFIDITKGDSNSIFTYYIHIFGEGVEMETIGCETKEELVKKYNSLVARFQANIDDTFDTSEFDSIVEEVQNMESAKEAEGKCNGWKNYETWCLNLWLTNEADTYFTIRDFAMTHDLDETTLFIQQMTEDMIPDMKSGFISDIIRHSIESIDYYEIAKDFAE